MKRAALSTKILAVLLTCMVLVSPGAVAQVAPTPLPGLSVTGQGDASAPAETATIAIMVTSGDYYKDPAMMDAEASPAPRLSAEETVQPIVDALVAAGVPAADIEILTDPSSLFASTYDGPTMYTVRFTIADPTADGIGGLLEAVADAAAEAGLYINMANALYGVADCAALDRAAREAAVADARDQAATQAELLDVSLGNVIASRDDVYGTYSYSGMYSSASTINTCTMAIADGSMTSVYNAPAFDPSVEPTVTVSRSIELVFEIVPGGI